MEFDYSKAALLQFIDIAQDKGYVTPIVAKNWKSAVGKLLNDLAETEEADVRNVALEMAAHRVANREPGALSSESLQSYKSRVKAAIDEFVDWTEHRTTYRPKKRNNKPQNGKAQKMQTGNSRGRPEHQVHQERLDMPGSAPQRPMAHDSAAISNSMMLQVPVRRGFMAQVVVPEDLTREEAKRLGQYLMLAAGSDDSGQE